MSTNGEHSMAKVLKFEPQNSGVDNEDVVCSDFDFSLKAMFTFFG